MREDQNFYTNSEELPKLGIREKHAPNAEMIEKGREEFKKRGLDYPIISNRKF